MWNAFFAMASRRLLDHLGEPEAARSILRAMELSTADGVLSAPAQQGALTTLIAETVIARLSRSAIDN